MKKLDIMYEKVDFRFANFTISINSLNACL